MKSKNYLNEKYSFYYRLIEQNISNQKTDVTQYENSIKKIAEFNNIEDFWKIFQYIKKPEKLNNGIEIQLFKNEIKPLWEDELNKKGGRFSIKLKKELSSFVWEEIILHFIGGNINNKIKDEINGIVISIRKDFCFLQIWFKKYEKNIINDISNYLRDILFIPKEIDLDVKSFTKQYDNYYRRNSYKGKYNKL
jgi:translation initiation factor 4E